MEYLNWINFILLNYLLIKTSSKISQTFFEEKTEKNTSLNIINTFVIFTSYITILLIILGIIEIIDIISISIFSYIFCLLSLFLLRKKANTQKAKPLKLNPSFLIIFSPLFIILLLRGFNAILQTPFEYDSLAYHLPFVAEWLQSGSLREIYYSAFASPIGYYPSNYELLDLWTMIPFQSDYFANILNFGILIIFIISFLEILKTLKVNKTLQIISVASVIYLPIFLRQIGLPLVDLYFSTTFATSILFLLKQYLEKPKYSNYLIFGLSLGLFIGTKYLGIVYAFIPILVFLIINISKKINKKYFFITFISIFLTGSFFYLRNYLNSGNPLFPTEISILGKTIFQGYKGVNEVITNTSILQNLDSLSTLKDLIKNYYFMTGYGIRLFIVLLIPLAIFSFYKQSKQDKKITLILLFSTLAYLFLYLISPYSFRDFTPNIRYSMMFLILLTISFTYFLNQIKNKTIYYTLIIFATIHTIIYLLIFSPENILHNDKLIIDLKSIIENFPQFLIFTLTAIIFIIFFHLKNSKLKLATILILLLSTTYLFFYSNKLRSDYSEYFYEKIYEIDPKLSNMAKAFVWLNKNTETKNIAYTGFNFHYPLYGENLDRKVHYININECTYCRYVDYKNSEKSIRRDPNEKQWLNNLKTFSKDYIVVSSAFFPEDFIIEEEWILNNPNIFKLVYSNDFAKIYQIHSIY